MPDITCYLADLNITAYPKLADTLPLQGKPLSAFFQAASMLPSMAPAINLSLNPSLRNKLTPNTPMGAGDTDLQDALSQITQLASPTTVPSVALIFADYYTGNLDAYGFMFDLDLTGPSYGPRQGCAIFLEKIHTVIQNARKGDPDFCDLAAYTAIHELGHIFNLWHIPTPPSFMLPCPPAEFLQASSFVPDEQNYLQNAANPAVANYVLPGGSTFSDRGPIGPSGGDISYLLPKPPPKLKLRVRLSHSEFWHFEPVELDVRLSLADKQTESTEIADQIDPGYESCGIWITRPDGERFRYRSPNRFCDNPKTLRITREQPFERDISIFRQSGSHTFAMAGDYEVQMVLRLSAKVSVESNILHFTVRHAESRSRQYAAMQELFMSEETVKLLRYKNRPPSASVYSRLKRFAERYKSTPSACAIHYALGRALVNMAKMQTDIAHSRRARHQGLVHLEKAAKHPELSKHRKDRIEELLSE